jgi:hypothetical protein
MMARILRMPTEAELPPGGIRDLVELIFVFYRAAHRPTLRVISKAIRDGDFDATASEETIRKVLHGTTVPTNWETMKAIGLGLASIGNWQPRDEIQFNGVTLTVTSHLSRQWHRALDEPFYDKGQPMPF